MDTCGHDLQSYRHSQSYDPCEVPYTVSNLPSSGQHLQLRSAHHSICRHVVTGTLPKPPGVFLMPAPPPAVTELSVICLAVLCASRVLQQDNKEDDILDCVTLLVRLLLEHLEVYKSSCPSPPRR